MGVQFFLFAIEIDDQKQRSHMFNKTLKLINYKCLMAK